MNHKIDGLQPACSLIKAATIIETNALIQQRAEHPADRGVQIIVAGPTFSNKTLISTIIEDALKKHGFENVVVNNAEESPAIRENLLRRWPEQFNADELTTLRQKPIGITEASLPRGHA